jgi:hypothetical protein
MKKEEGREKKSLARSASSINCTTKLKKKLEKERKSTPGKLLTGSYRFLLLLSRHLLSKTLQSSSIRLSYTTRSLDMHLQVEEINLERMENNEV